MQEAKLPKLSAKTANHARYLKALETSSLTLCTGPAGSGKTFMACGVAARLLAEGRVGKLLLSRPLVQCTAGGAPKLGFLPGDKDEKVAPYLLPLLEALEEFLGASKVEKYLHDGTIEMAPLELLRGRSPKGTFMILDEAQNAEYGQLHMFLTRLDMGSRVVVAGDAAQADLFSGRTNPLLEVIRRFRPDCHSLVSIVRLTRADVMRPELVQWIDERLASDGVYDAAFCPACQDLFWYEKAHEGDLLECCHCHKAVELLDEKGTFAPILVHEDEAEHRTVPEKPHARTKEEACPA
jgi:phosphate starvation-inducible PhoH-like protein